MADALTSVTSPVSAWKTICESPHPKGNLTGIPRKVKDNCAELYNLVQRWNLLQIQGHKLLREITNVQQNKSSECEEDVEEEEEKPPRTSFSVGLQQTCNELLQIVEDSSMINAKMHQITSQFESLVSLENLQNSFSHLQSESESSSSSSLQTNTSLPIFHTWRMIDYADTSRSLSMAYDLDLQLKRDIADGAAHVQSSDAALFLLAAWSHQPHVTDRIQLRLEAMLTESGHRYKLHK